MRDEGSGCRVQSFGFTCRARKQWRSEAPPASEGQRGLNEIRGDMPNPVSCISRHQPHWKVPGFGVPGSRFRMSGAGFRVSDHKGALQGFRMRVEGVPGRLDEAKHENRMVVESVEFRAYPGYRFKAYPGYGLRAHPG